MAWGSKVSATQLTGVVGTEQFFDTIIPLNPGESAELTIKSDTNGTTDDLLVTIYKTLDDSAEVWEIADQFLISRTPDPNIVPRTIAGGYRWRVGVKRNGTTDIFVCDLTYRRDGVSL